MTADLRDLAAEVVLRLREQSATLGTAESLTGGRLAAAVTSVPGASAAYLGGVVSYATALKVGVLGVPQELVDRYGVVSPQCALAMAHGVVGLSGATYALSTTGVAGPDRQDDRPAGTVHVTVLGPGGHLALPLQLPGDRDEVQDATCRAALTALLRILDGEEAGLR